MCPSSSVDSVVRLCLQCASHPFRGSVRRPTFPPPLAGSRAVFRLDKLKPHIGKLQVPANVALDMYELEELHLAAKLKHQQQQLKQQRIERSPSPQPGDVNYVDPDFDPDNVVTRGADTDTEEDAAVPPPTAGRVGGNALDDFSFNTHS